MTTVKNPNLPAIGSVPIAEIGGVEALGTLLTRGYVELFAEPKVRYQQGRAPRKASTRKPNGDRVRNIGTLLVRLTGAHRNDATLTLADTLLVQPADGGLEMWLPCAWASKA